MHGRGNALEKTAMLPEFSPKCNFVALAGGRVARTYHVCATTVVA